MSLPLSCCNESIVVNCPLADWWIWLMTQRTMLFFTIVYQLLITWTVNQTRLGTNFFLSTCAGHTLSKSYIKSRAETVSVLWRLIRFEPLPPLSVLLFMPRISRRSLRVLHFCSKTNHTPCWVSWSRCLSSSFTLACLDWRLGAVALTSCSLPYLVFLQKEEG